MPNPAGRIIRLLSNEQTPVQTGVCYGTGKRSDGLDIGSLFAFGALGDFKLHFLPFLEGFESIHVDGGKMRK